jgi:hypothetical protein
LSVDPLTKSYPMLTPYQFAGNMPIAFIDLDGLEEVRPIINYDPIGQYRNGSYPVLGPSEWYLTDRRSASGTFASAAAYNTKNLKSAVYQPVDQIHRYYVWAGKKIDKTKSNIKFFHAARDVTSFAGVGGAFSAPEFITGLSDHARKSLADVNSRLLKENMPIIREILTTGKSNLFVGKTGILWDFEYVNRVQTFLTEVITNDPLSNEDRLAINNNFEKFEWMHQEYILAKKLLGVEKLDYLPQKERMAIGRSLVFMLHLQRTGFRGSSEYQDAINYLQKEYGDKNVLAFLDEIFDNRKTHVVK